MNPPEKAVGLAPEVLAVHARTEEILTASQWVADWCERHAVSAEAAHKLDVCLNEALANLATHAALPPDAQVNLLIESANDGDRRWAHLQIDDPGPPFDPVAFSARQQPSNLDDARPGGLGVLMMQNYADKLDYHYQNQRNFLKFSVQADSSAARDGAPVAFRRRDERLEGSSHESSRTARVERRKAPLNWVPLFRDVSEDNLLQAIGDCLVLPLSAGDELLHAGEVNHSVFVLLSGQLTARLAQDGATGACIILHPGECIGEMSAIDGKRVSASVVAHSDCRVLKLTQDDFWQRVMILPGVARNLLVSLTERMRRTNDMALQSLREQLELAHLRKELTVAHDLQISMVPLQRPIFPHREDVEVCGFMEPASKVGGDFFDAFFVEEDRLFICIGDVSGHGIAAAILMARIIGLVRIVALDFPEPDKLLAVLNDRLCEGNDTEMYATLFCAFLDMTSGRLHYANAGHCPPLLHDGLQAVRLDIPRGPLVGAFPAVRFGSMEIQLRPGDTLFCYTDGLTEAEDPAGNAFDETRCIAHLARPLDGSLAVLLTQFREAVATFSGSQDLTDDCTMLAVRRL